EEHSKFVMRQRRPRVVLESKLELFDCSLVIQRAQLLLACLEMRASLLVNLGFYGRRTAGQPKAKHQCQCATPQARRHVWNVNEGTALCNEDEVVRPARQRESAQSNSPEHHPEQTTPGQECGVGTRLCVGSPAADANGLEASGFSLPKGFRRRGCAASE